ncbi:MAG: hypothetical protein AAF513_15280 [Pseudomonadota bacterium]
MRKPTTDLLKKIAVGGALVATSWGAYAATQGTVGATSSGTVLVELQVPVLAKISNLTDFIFPTFAGANMSADRGACIYTNTGNYDLTITASGGSFDMTDGTDFIPYAVSFSDGGAFGAITYGGTVTSSNAATVDNDCGGGGSTNATVRVEVDAVDASAVPQGTYNSTMTLLVSPV